MIKSKIYEIYENKDNIFSINKYGKGYIFNYFNRKMSLSSIYSDVFEEYVYILEFIDKLDSSKENPVLASFQRDFEEDKVYFSILFKFLEEKRGFYET